MNTKIKVSEFVSMFKEAASFQDECEAIRAIIRRTYVPYMEKVTVLKALLGTSFTEQDGLMVLDHISLHLNYRMAVIFLYTNLEIEKNDDEDKEALIRAYDMLAELGLFEKIIELIGADYTELETVRRNYLENMLAENALTMQFAKQVTRFGSIISAATLPAIRSLQANIDNLSETDKEKLKTQIFPHLVPGGGAKKISGSQSHPPKR